MQHHTIYILSQLIQAFYILPASNLGPFNPRELPREIFTRDIDEEPTGDVGKLPRKKKGRPTKRDKRVKAIKALQQVDKWLERNSVPSRQTSAASTPGLGPGHDSDNPSLATHVLMSNPPIATLNIYRTQKMQLLDAIATDLGTGGKEALKKANEAVLMRLKKLDRIAAEKGLELGSEGGERTGLERVEKAMAELEREEGPRGGILGLLDGGGVDQ